PHELASMAMAPSAPPVVQEEPPPGKQLRNQLAAAVRSINWSYAIFWSISNSHPRVLTWKDGFYHGEVKTRKIANSMELTVDQLVLQRSEQLRELYESLLSGACDHRAERPGISLWPEDLGDMEWYYVVCMTYAFRPGQGCYFQVPEDSDLLNSATTSFNELKFRRCMANSLANQTRETNNIIVPDDLDQNATETITADGHELGEFDCLFNANHDQITAAVDDFYGLWEELLDVQTLHDTNLITEAAPEAKDAATSSISGDSSRVTHFINWTRSESDELVVPVIEEPQKLLKKVVAAGAWMNNTVESTARTTHERGIKNHVMSERRRREKLNEMYSVLKSLVPTIHRTDKASILAETIAYLKELEQKVKELESRRESISSPDDKRPACHENEITGKRVPARIKRKKGRNDMEMEHHWFFSKDGPSNVNVTVIGMEVLLKVQCQWKDLLMTHVFDTIKSLDLDVLSVEASTPNHVMGLKIRARSVSPNPFQPGIISEALQRAITNNSRDS
ncbi:hypothetical protein EJB05_38424, partial [Eragrostis curvula]